MMFVSVKNQVNQSNSAGENMCERSHEWEIMGKGAEFCKKLLGKADGARQHTNGPINQTPSFPTQHLSPFRIQICWKIYIIFIFVNFHAWLILNMLEGNDVYKIRP